jgi:photosystem II stability/assembly factor-like uncharacterized protein
MMTVQAAPAYTPRPTTTSIPPLSPGQPVVPTSIRMFDPTHGWAFEAGGHLLHTADGGLTWQDVTPTGQTYDGGGFFALSANVAWATPYQAGCYTADCPAAPWSTIVWHTTDGGLTWQAGETLCLGGDCGYDMDMSPEYLDTLALQFLDENNGWILMTVAHLMIQDRYRIYRTTDGGNTWTMVSDNMGGPMTFMATGLAFQDRQTGWFATSEVGGATDPAKDWSIYRSQDAGHTWDSFALPAPGRLPADFEQAKPWCGIDHLSVTPPATVDVGFYCIAFVDGHYRYDEVYTRFHYRSLDGGQTWVSWLATGNEQFLDATTAWRLLPGSPGQVQRTTDGGRTWTTIKDVAWENAQFNFIDVQTGWALVTAGDISALVQTTDGGQTWVEIHPVVGP